MKFLLLSFIISKYVIDNFFFLFFRSLICRDWSVFGSSDTAIAKPITVPKERKKHDRFNGMSEEDVSKRTLPDHLAANLDIIIVSVTFSIKFYFTSNFISIIVFFLL